MKKELYRQDNQLMQDAFDRIEVEIHLQKKNNGIQSLLLCGSEPRVGTTTIAIELAISMAEAGWKTVLIDADIRKGTAYKRNAGSENANLVTYLEDKSDLKQVLIETNYKNMKYIFGGSGEGNTVSLLCSAKMQQLIKELKEEFDYIIFDAPSINSVVDAGVIGSLTDGTIIVTSQGSYKKQLSQAMEQLRHVGANILGVIMNKVEKAEYKRYMKNYNYFKDKKYVNKKYKATVKKGEDN
ncbi:MAG: CpsD/CapB family tyrosine-protein kinase [Lachnospiraceae bacterium]|nr:CpsD/CapB family tyrosine-protein kinase [Lachnospiraceae bacterium]MBR3683795.1 CpsD/CapB family tyrosine-protein kinase [Lachnospiraceae bacterium]